MFKQASCVPDGLGRCPTSVLVVSSVVPHPEDREGDLARTRAEGRGRGPDLARVDLARASGSVKVWVRCGKTCFRKDVHFGPGEVGSKKKKNNNNNLLRSMTCRLRRR